MSKEVFGHKVCGWYLVPFSILQLVLIRFTQLKLCCISQSTMKRMQNSNRKLYSPLFSHAYRNFMFVDFLNEYINPPNCVDY
jgi:hypothetical protein